MKDQVKFKIKQKNRKLKTFLSKTRLISQKMLKNKKKENEKDLGLFFELSEEKEIIFKQTPVNTLIRDVEKLRKIFLRVVVLI